MCASHRIGLNMLMSHKQLMRSRQGRKILSRCLNQEGFGYGSRVAWGFGSPAKVKEGSTLSCNMRHSASDKHGISHTLLGGCKQLNACACPNKNNHNKNKTHRLNEQLAIAPPADTRYRRISSRLSARKSEIFTKGVGGTQNCTRAKLGTTFAFSCSDKQAVRVDMKVTFEELQQNGSKELFRAVQRPCNVFARPTSRLNHETILLGNPKRCGCLYHEAGLASQSFQVPPKVVEGVQTVASPFSLLFHSFKSVEFSSSLARVAVVTHAAQHDLSSSRRC